MVIGVPSLVFATSTPYLANPKSPITTLSSYKKILANLTSLCITLCLWSTLKPFIICIKKYTASSSDNLPIFFKYPSRSPLLQY